MDLHLHPRWQRTRLSFLSERFPNTQFIATAHSPLVVRAATGANIVLLRREGDHVVIDNDVERIKNWRVDQILTSEMFGLESARPPQVGQALQERQKILAKARLTKADEKQLAVTDEGNALLEKVRLRLQQATLDTARFAAMARAAAVVESFP